MSTIPTILMADGKEFETEKAKACEYGFHACENPIDIFSYYDPANSIFAEVEQSGVLSKHEDDSKVSSTKIKIKAERYHKISF